MPELLATARLQLHAGFDLHAAAAQVPYYRELGVSHLYLSPIAEARPGSSHGYDVIDPTRVSLERGGDEGLAALSAALRQHGMGAVLDIVPNHMAADAANPWWRDVLHKGQQSPFAPYFDIDWHSPSSPGRVWLPWLTAPLDTVMERGELKIEHREGTGAVLLHKDWSLPLAEGSSNVGGLDDIDALRAVLDRQHYRLAWWRSSSDAVNYRRFFDIDGLVALNILHDAAFDAVHALPLRLIEQGVIDGLRIDHVDGLADPEAYLRRLRDAMNQAAARRDDGVVPSLHVEKILRREERLPASWPVDGSTGYEMMDRIGAVMHCGSSLRVLGPAWYKASHRTASFAVEERLARHQWLRRGLRTDFKRCLRALRQCLHDTPLAADISDDALERACADVLAEMPVYRTYITGTTPSAHDARLLVQAFEAADQYGHPDDAEVRHWLRALLLDGTHQPATHLATARRRFEQLAAPLAAKSVEDTAFYRYGVWISRNEVGSDPAQFSLDVASFHRDMQWRAAVTPHALSATATHDHKRGEDLRARLAALSEDPHDWLQALSQWLPRLRACAGRVRTGDLVMLLQTLIGAWPLSTHDDDMSPFRERIGAWWIKALREARLHSHWTRPNEEYEGDAMEVVRRLFEDAELAEVREGIARLARTLDAPGALNGLVSVTLRHTLPGVPDLYQGCDYWDQSLVDPDNRRAVDYQARRQSLQADTSLQALLEGFRDGAIKQRLIRQLLASRQALPELFSRGDYQPWMAYGPAARNVLAFTRRHGDELLMVAVPLHCLHAGRGQQTPHVPGETWRDTFLPAARGLSFRHLLNDQPIRSTRHGEWSVADLFATWPVAVLHAKQEET